MPLREARMDASAQMARMAPPALPKIADAAIATALSLFASPSTPRVRMHTTVKSM